MQIDIITIFPKMFSGPFSESIIKRAQENGKVKVNIHDLRDWATGKHKQVDDTPYGGGGGMVMMIEPIHKALKDLKKDNSVVVATTAKGETYKQSAAKKFSKLEHIIIICGHYEGLDQRILDTLVDYPVSVGNYVLTGGELPAMIISDSIVRLIPGVLGNEASPKSDSYYKDDQTRQYPIYTKPEIYEVEGKELKVPDILLSGDHKRIEEWREYNNKK